MLPPPKIRKAEETDAEVIAEIYNESILAVDSTMIDVPINGGEIVSQMKAFSEKESYYLMERDEYAVGWGVIKRFGKGPAYAYTGETSVFLRRQETRKGYGTRMKKYLLDQCEAFGYHHLVARIWASNAHSIAYNKGFGYEVVGIQREIGFMAGEWKDIALLQLVFEGQAPALTSEPSVLSAHPSALQAYSPRGGYRFAAEVRAGDAEELRALLRQAGEQDYHHILAWLSPGEVEMYASVGFEIVGVQREVKVGVDGWEDVVVVQHLFPKP